MNSPRWRLEVLGQVRLIGPEPVTLPVERKLAACLTYLALEGSTSRSRLVGLLWPDSPEATARNNLSQMLRKLRLAAGQELITGTDELTLAPALSVDLAQVRDLVTQGHSAELLRLGGTLLHNLNYDDCPDLEDYLIAQREQLQEWRHQALRSALAAAERNGEVGLALTLARQLLDLDPVSEEAWRHVMRLTYVSGDRPAALRAYQRCKEVLRREFGVEPLPETKQLAREIDRGTVPVPASPRPVALPLAVQRPPHLVGREREWAQMDEAWGQATYIYLRGAPGSGKTRLARDFAASKGEYVVYEGRPGDTAVPFASSARNARTVLERFPDIPLQEWVRREMARVLPELARPGEILPPLGSEADVLRLRQAMQVFFVERTGHLDVVLADDWQFFDYDSNQDGVFMWNTPLPQGVTGRFPPMIITYRRDEVAPESEALILRLIEAGLGILIDLEPLPEDGMNALMTDLGVPEDEQTRRRLQAHSGGNPLFLLETVKLLLETGQLSGSLPERLPLPPRVGQLIERRLALLSTPALQAARAAALLQRDFDVELVAQTLSAPLFDLLPAWEELETAQIVRGERFSHDLVYEAVYRSVPASLRPLLHRGAARALEGQQAHPARIAQHWQDGQKPALAAPHWLRAAEYARARYLRTTAAHNLGQAAEAYWAAGEADAAFAAWSQQGEDLFYLEDTGAVVALAALLEERATAPRQHGIARRIRSASLWMQGDVAGAVRVAQLGLERAVQTSDPLTEAELLELLVVISAQNHLSLDLEAALQRWRSTAVQRNDAALQARAHDALALHLGSRQPQEARRHAEAGEALFQTLNDPSGAAGCAHKAVALCLQLGDLDAVRDALTRKAGYLSRGEVIATQRLFQWSDQACCDFAEGRFAQALDALAQALALDVMHGAVWTPELRAWRATILAELGAAEEALTEARELLEVLPGSPNQRPEPRVLVLGVLSDLGGPEEVQTALGMTERAVVGQPYWEARFELLRTGSLPPTERLPVLDKLVQRSRGQGWRGVALAAEVRRNAARLQLGLPPLPWEADAADRPAGVIGLPEWLTVRARVATAQGDQDMAQTAAAWRSWLEHTTEQEVPPEYRPHFLRRSQRFLALSPAETQPLDHDRSG